MRKLIFTILVSFLVGAVIGYVICSMLHEGRAAREPTGAEFAAIMKAQAWKAKREGASVEAIARLTQPSVIYFSKATCVQLKPAPGVAGGRTVICFDKQSGAVVNVEEIGE